MAARKINTTEALADAAGDDQSGHLTFEQAMAQLSETVRKLEGGELPLEDSVALFTEGMALSKHATAKLAQAEKRIEELLSVDEAGRPVVRSFDDGE
jgi:exodeoxyribonuclease VII small subunit